MPRGGTGWSTRAQPLLGLDRLDRHPALQPRVVAKINLAHPALPEPGIDTDVPKARADVTHGVQSQAVVDRPRAYHRPPLPADAPPVAAIGSPLGTMDSPLPAGGSPVPAGGSPLAADGSPVAAKVSPLGRIGSPLPARRSPLPAGALPLPASRPPPAVSPHENRQSAPQKAQDDAKFALSARFV
ncbi:MAG TPA: hypothetical protein VLX28_06105 [Thermoanaerobaculia bacterium]|nr:hypothetical protein [Thermoanaerobaculia bacterium]